jgi:hypothetical protein
VGDEPPSSLQGACRRPAAPSRALKRPPEPISQRPGCAAEVQARALGANGRPLLACRHWIAVRLTLRRQVPSHGALAALVTLTASVVLGGHVQTAWVLPRAKAVTSAPARAASRAQLDHGAATNDANESVAIATTGTKLCSMARATSAVTLVSVCTDEPFSRRGTTSRQRAGGALLLGAEQVGKRREIGTWGFVVRHAQLICIGCDRCTGRRSRVLCECSTLGNRGPPKPPATRRRAASSDGRCAVRRRVRAFERKRDGRACVLAPAAEQGVCPLQRAPVLGAPGLGARQLVRPLDPKGNALA